MNTRALKRFRAKLAADEPVYGMFVTLDAPNITDMGVAIGLDWIVLDAEHGHLDWGDLMNHLRGAVRRTPGRISSSPSAAETGGPPVSTPY